jgi:Fe2+ or Zn2+ uptake regulation protein
MAAASRKALSLEEKRQRAMNYLQESRGVYQLRDLEKSLPKHKGITAQTVKEVLQSLVDDRLICSEKIGSSNYFWSFPSQARKHKEASLGNLRAKLQTLHDTNDQLGQHVEQLRIRKVGVDANLFKEYRQLQAELNAVAKELDAYADVDPVTFEQTKQQLLEKKDAVSQWTDVLCALEDYCVRHLDIARENFRHMFELTDDMFE